MNIFNGLENKKDIILVISIFLNIILIGGLGFCLYLYFNKECICESEPLEIKNDEIICENNKEEEVISFFVEIKGAVNKPGVYEVNSDNIINDVVNMAGGFTVDAYTDNINLSKKVVKELVIYIYKEKDFKNSEDKTTDNICVCPSYDITVCTDDKKSEIVPEDNKDAEVQDSMENNNNTNEPEIKQDNDSTLNLNKKININIATKNELMNLNGIGESKAKKIIEYREKNGGFKSIEEIKKVSGIGEAIYAKIKDNITI